MFVNVNEHVRFFLLVGWGVMTAFYQRGAVIIALFCNFRTPRRPTVNCRIAI